MASSASPDLKLEIMADGERIGDWGNRTNTNLRGIEEAICQTNDITFAGTATVALSISDYSDPPQLGRGFRLNLTGTGTAGQILQVPDIQKSYIVNNSLSVDTIIKNSTATPTVTIPAGKTGFVYSTSAGVVNSISTLNSANVVGTFEISSNASVGGTLNIGGITTSGSVSADGSLNVSGNASVGGTLAVAGDTDVTNFSANGTLDASGNGSVGGTFNVEGDLKNTSGNLTVDPATQIVEVKGNGSDTEGQIQLNCHANSHGQIIKAQPHSEGVTNTMLLPKGSNSTLVSEIATQTLTNKTLGATSVNGTFNISGNASVGGTLTVTGDSDVTNFSANGTLDVSGNASVGGTLAVTGDTDVANLSASGTFDVGGNASVGGTLAVTNTITGSSSVSDSKGDLRKVPKSGIYDADYTLAASNAGQYIVVASSGVSLTIPTSTFATGDVITVISTDGATASISSNITSFVAGGESATATMTLGANGVANILFTSASFAILTGNIS